jgi:DNA-binding LytR/AlgR family response regulator
VKILVVDDEDPARRRLVRMLAAVDGVTIAGEAIDADTTLARVAELAPDLVMLDIQLPGLDGLALAARYAHLPPIIFVTAHDEYAVRAFELDAVDYLVKPVRPERLAAAIERARRRIDAPPPRSTAAAADVLTRLAGAASAGEAPRSSTRVAVVDRGVVRLFDARDVSRFWSSDKYTLFRSAGAEHLTQEPLSALAERLEPHGFMRVHRGELVNLARVRAIRSQDGQHVVELDDGQESRVSRRELTTFKAALGL